MAEFVELEIEAGASFETTITVTDESTGEGKTLANTTPKAQMRKSYYSSTAVDFDITITDANNGVFVMSIDAANTANIRAGRYVYDVELHETVANTAKVSRIVEGVVVVLPNVTRS